MDQHIAFQYILTSTRPEGPGRNIPWPDMCLDELEDFVDLKHTHVGLPQNSVKYIQQFLV